MRLDRPIAAAAIAVAVAVVAACGSIDVPRRSTPAATAGAPLAAESAVAPPLPASTQAIPSSAPAVSPRPTPDPALFKPARSALKVPLDYTLGTEWVVVDDLASLVEFADVPPGTFGTGPGAPPRWRLAIGIPYGFATAADVVRSFRTVGFHYFDELISEWCPEMAEPTAQTVAGFSGRGFACDDTLDHDFLPPAGYLPFYPISRAGRDAAGIPARIESPAGWFLLQRDERSQFVVAELDGAPVVFTLIQDHASHGPGAGAQELAAIRDLHLSFRP